MKTVSCPAFIEFGDDFGDNVTTFRCGLEDGHAGPHEERGKLEIDGLEYVVRWNAVAGSAAGEAEA